MAEDAKLPKKIIVYYSDEEIDGELYLITVSDFEEIPDDVNGRKVGIYQLSETLTFKVTRELV